MKQLFVLLLVANTLFSCGGGGGGSSGSTARTITVSWDANHEPEVHQPGGGYRVYYSQTQGFALTDPGVTMVDLPYQSGATAPTSITLKLGSGEYYLKLVAYSAFPAATTFSAPSAEITIKGQGAPLG
ncbi:MAG: hypothetical protein PVJ63_00415 [Thioalkalispiraceae bacterium]|jgi:hypothetical protein